jgi:hypothetical protein
MMLLIQGGVSPDTGIAWFHPKPETVIIIPNFKSKQDCEAAIPAIRSEHGLQLGVTQITTDWATVCVFNG